MKHVLTSLEHFGDILNEVATKLEVKVKSDHDDAEESSLRLSGKQET